MSADQLKNFMEGLRANPRYLRVERLGATAPQLQSPEQNSLLTVNMELYGFTRNGEATAADNGGKSGRSKP
jgi:hypothetical protein